MIRLAIRVPEERAEVVLAELLELAPAGVEESRGREGIVEYAVYGAPGELPGLPDLDAMAGGGVVQVSSTEIADDWQERWKQFHRPVLIDSPACGIPPCACARRGNPLPRPRAMSRDRHRPRPGVRDGRARQHAPVPVAAARARSQRERPGPVLDVGTGSGVLAIAARSLGFNPVLGLDHELESVTPQARTRSSTTARSRSAGSTCEPLAALADARLPGARRCSSRTSCARFWRNLRAAPGRPAHLVAGGLLTPEVDEIAGRSPDGG